jgi:membrane dipeptidase
MPASPSCSSMSTLASPRRTEDRVTRPLPILDGHNDALLALARNPKRPDSLLERSPIGHLDLPRARDGGFAGGFFAMFTPAGKSSGPRRPAAADRYELPLAPTPSLARAQWFTQLLAARLFRDERASDGRLEVVRTAAGLRGCLEGGVLAAIFHIEGAEAIDTDLNALEVFYQSGLRSLGLVWSRPNAFGHGVPFRFPSSPDTGPGLTDAGRALVRTCNELGVLIDLSHLNEKGFWDVARLSSAPLVATHSNAHALCPISRNLTDDQLRAIRDSGGMVGVNFATSMLRADGRPDPDTPLEVMVRHFEHLIERLGEDKVGFGSDFDGTIVPKAIGDVAGLPRVIEALRAAGFDEPLLERIAFRNWLRVLEQTWAH